MIKANYRLAELKAEQLLCNLSIKELPVDLDKVVDSFKDLKMFSYSFFAERFSLTIEEVKLQADSDSGCCFYYPAMDKHIILYNDTIDNIGHIRWTIAHELGHYILNHHKRTDKTLFARNSLSKEEYKILEKEANCFARQLLAPPQVLREINIANPQFISNIGNISWQAANNVYRFLMQGAQIGVRYTSSNPIIRLFSGYIYDVKHSKFSKTCKHVFSRHNANFCPVCKSQAIVSNSIFFKGGKEMLYQNIELDEVNRAKDCPTCSNENLIGEFCHICGTYILNKYTGFDELVNSVDPFSPGVSWNSHNEGCGQLLEGNARFCHSCGATSTFYQEGLLSHWEDEINSKSQKQAAATIDDISDEDLPF